MTEKETKMIDVFNKGARTYTTSVGPLLPKQSVSVPEAEAKSLMDYFDIVDLHSVAPKANAELNRLKAENAEMKKELEGKKEASPKEPEHAAPKKGSGKGGKKGEK